MLSAFSMNYSIDSINHKTTGMLSEHHAGLPVWIRAPKQGGLDKYCGLTRSKLYELASRNRIVSVSLKEPHQIRGTRLFNLPSILTYIDSMAEPAQVAESHTEE